MKSHKNNNIRILQQEAAIPKIVEQKMENAFLDIQNRELSCTPESEHVTVHKRSAKKTLSFAAAAAFVLCAVTACAAAYTQWSQSLEVKLQITEGQKQMLEEDHAWSVLDQSVTSQGVTITAKQCIVDSYCAYITFKIEGYDLPKGASPGMKRLDVAIGDYSSQDLYYYADFYQDSISAGDWLIDNKIPETDCTGSFVMDDGSLEYQIRILTLEKGALLGQPIHVTLQGLGNQKEKSWPVYDITGFWEFDWILEGTADTTEIILNKTIDDTGVTIIKAELSPISVKFTFERPQGTGMWPRLFGFRTKDGNMHLNTTGSGISRFDDFSKRRYTSINTCINVATRIIDAEQIGALVFVDIADLEEAIRKDPNKHLYTVPIKPAAAVHTSGAHRNQVTIHGSGMRINCAFRENMIQE